MMSPVSFAKENEYSGGRDLRVAIVKGFAREPYHHDFVGKRFKCKDFDKYEHLFKEVQTLPTNLFKKEAQMYREITFQGFPNTWLLLVLNL